MLGVEMCRKLLLEARNQVEGAYLMPSLRALRCGRPGGRSGTHPRDPAILLKA